MIIIVKYFKILSIVIHHLLFLRHPRKLQINCRVVYKYTYNGSLPLIFYTWRSNKSDASMFLISIFNFDVSTAIVCVLNE